jgi:pimeloyl-ACP methyl ester carboxylesterase
MIEPTPVVFIHGFIGTFDMRGWNGPQLAPDLLGYGAHRTVPFDAKQPDAFRAAIERIVCAPPA